MNTSDEPRISTKAFADRHQVKPTSVRARVCRFGSYFGVVPERLANGRLLFPDVLVKKGDEHGA